MGKQNNQPNSVVDKAFIAQQASAEFTRVVSEIHGLYFEQLRALSQSGALGAASIPAQQQLTASMQTASVVQGVSSAAGMAALMIPGYGPLVAAGLVAAGGTTASWMSQGANLEYTQQMTVGHAQMMASMIAATTGRSGGSVYQAFTGNLAPERYGVGLERMQGYASIDNQAVPFGVSAFNSLISGTVSSMSPEGNVPLAVRQANAMQQIASLNHRSFGFSPADYISSRGVEYTNPGESRAAFDARMAQGRLNVGDADMKRLFDAADAGFGRNVGYDEFKEAVEQRGIGPDGLVKIRDSGWNDIDVKVNKAAMAQFYSTARNQPTKGVSSDFIREMLFIGGPQAAALLREKYGTNPKMLDDIASVEKGDYNDYLTEQFTSSRGGLQASIYSQTGQYGAAVGALSSSGGSMQSAANRLKGIAFEGGDPNGRVINDEAAQKYFEMSADATSKLVGASQAAFGAAGIDVAIGYGRAKQGMTQYAMYGDQGGLGRSYEQLGDAIHGDMARTNARLNSGMFSGPEEEAQLRSTLIDLMQRERTVREEGVRALDQANVRLTSFAAGAASSAQNTAYTLGVGGTAGQGYATATFEQFARRAAAATKATGDIVSQMKSTGMSDADIQGSEVYQESLSRQRSAESDSAQAFVNQANVPTSIGTRRSQSANTFLFNYLQNFPGTAGNIWNVGKNLLSDIEHANQEDNARYQQLLQNGAFNGAGGQALAEQFQNRYQDRMQQYGQVYGSLSVDWPNKMAQLVAGSPNTINYISPSLAERVAVGAGIHAPGFGSNLQDLPGYLKDALNPGSLAGSFGTPEGTAVTGMTGFNGARGSLGMLPTAPGGGGGNIVISGELKINGDGTASIRGKIVDPRTTTRSNSMDTSAAAHGEFGSLGGLGKTH